VELQAVATRQLWSIGIIKIVIVEHLEVAIAAETEMEVSVNSRVVQQCVQQVVAQTLH
jgi:hypothetical protein